MAEIAGIQVWDENGKVVRINADNAGFTYIGEETVTTNNQGLYANNLKMENPFIAFRGLDGPASLYFQNDASSRNNYVRVETPEKNSSVTIYYYQQADRRSAGQGPDLGYGFQVFDAVGNTVFNSQQNQLLPLDFYQGSQSSGAGKDVVHYDRDFGPLVTPAFLIGNSVLQRNGGTNRYVGYYSKNGRAVIQDFSKVQNTPNPGNYKYLDFSAFIIDVSNIGLPVR